MRSTTLSPAIALRCALLCTLITAGCGWSQRPNLDEAALEPIEVRDQLLAKTQGKLALLNQGVWAFVRRIDDTSKAYADVKPGQLVILKPLEEDADAAHLFLALGVDK